MSRERRDNLLNELLPMARELLESHGAFIPFAGAMAVNGQIKLLGGNIARNQPDAAILDILAAGLAGGVRDGQYCVTAICFLASADQGTASDAICIEFEDSDLEPSSVIVRFTRDGEFIELGEITLMRCDSRVFKRLKNS